MDKKYLNTLEFPLILGRLARNVSFSAGKELALSLAPSPVFVEVQQRLQETREARYLLDAHGGISIGGAHDVRSLARNAARGALLQTADLLDISSTLRVGRRVQRLLGRLQGQVPHLADVAARIEPCEGLAEEIDRCINDQGEVVDHASAKLARIRRDLRTAHERLLDKLNRIVANPRNASYLQESLITQRSGRYVIPIKADFKGRIPGIVHDTSASGATLFVEPLSTVEMANRWRELQIEERKEVERILAELSGLVAGLVEELAWTVQALAELDLALAKARYANELDATEPILVPFQSRQPRSGARRASEPEATMSEGLHPGSTLDLRQARHPLLSLDSVVPIDVHLGDDYFVLIITGPNTGGKTVSLKTVGLMAAMAQSGLHLPVAENSSLSVFDGIYADIGDEQSIEQSLSTFSSHLTNIIRILDCADRQSLVLLDELGAGTDPVEGSALARAILTHLLERQITTLVATHYSELKVYANTTPGVENASVEFDLETLAPTYRMQIGLPGRSNAFAIAERLGLPKGIVRTGRALISPEDLETESLLAEIQEAHREALAARDEALLVQRGLAEKERQLEARLVAIEGERATILGEARAEARRELAAVRAEIEALRAEMPERQSVSALGEEWLAQAQARLAEQEASVPPPLPPRLPEEVVLPGEIAVDDTVWIRGLSTTGTVTELDGEMAEVQVGHFGVRVQRRELERRASSGVAKPKRAAPLVDLRAAPSVELDLRGQRVDEVLPRVDKYLDDAFLAGMPFVRIVHGKGTGALRQAVRQQLRDHPLVKSQRPGERGEGGSGVTIAYLIEA
ncbi:MAG TPA: Smr/MutS family protein [Anaerolineae bacterium]|nr:Smr/MutS family protein [Anaerolineae bacterium]